MWMKTLSVLDRTHRGHSRSGMRDENCKDDGDEEEWHTTACYMSFMCDGITALVHSESLV